MGSTHFVNSIISTAGCSWGAARSQAVQQVIAAMIDAPVVVSEAVQAVATGAAVQAAAVFEQLDHTVIQHRWGLGEGVAVERSALDETLRERYAALRDR